MLNLLIISNSAVVEAVRDAIQPMLKVRIDIVTDFDHGLKDVFEKRPAVVCIQEQIAGVTGESVARHIQMLLGSGAPAYILMHEASPRVKPMKGLFDHLIDLTHPREKIVSGIMDAMKTVLGDQWDKVYVPPRGDMSPQVAAVPEEGRKEAEELVDDLLSALETFGAEDESKAAAGESGSFATGSRADELASMLLENANRAAGENRLVPLDGGGTPQKSPEKPPEVEAVEKVETAEAVVAAIVEPAPGAAESEPLWSLEPAVAQPPEPAAAIPAVVPAVAAAPAAPAAARPPQKPRQPAPRPAAAGVAPGTRTPVAGPEAGRPPQPPVEFVISSPAPAVEEIPDDLLHAFEKNYRAQRSSRWRALAVIALLLVSLAGGSWYLVSRAPQRIPSFLMPVLSRVIPQGVQSSPPAPPAPSGAQAVRPPSPAPAPPKSPPPAARPLPAFIPAEGRDEAYSAQKPGWERYQARRAEYRLFRSGDAVKALQVIASGSRPLSERLLNDALKGLAGSTRFQVLSRETKDGFRITRGKIAGKGDVLLYRRKGALRAFVITLD